MSLELTDNAFEKEVLQSKEPVLVDFWAAWCGPCQMMGPIIEELAQKYEGKAVKIGKLNVDENPKIAEKYEVKGIPTLILFQNGEIKETLSGVQSLESLGELVDKYLG